jgi:hypothetical protein
MRNLRRKLAIVLLSLAALLGGLAVPGTAYAAGDKFVTLRICSGSTETVKFYFVGENQYGDHPRLPEVRHLLAYFLTMQDRDEASVEQFRLVDGYVDALPWRYDPDPAKEYCRLRDITVANAA